MSCLLAVAMAGSSSASAVLLPQQDTPPPAEANQATVPSENTPSEPGKSATAPEQKKAAQKKKRKAPALHRVRRHAKPKTQQPAPPPDNGEPRKTVVRHGGAQEPSAQIVPGMLPEEAARQRQSAEEMLASADDRLKQLSARVLDSTRQETVAHIRNYMAKARAALNDGDTQRGHTLALKAYLLADDLVKH